MPNDGEIGSTMAFAGSITIFIKSDIENLLVITANGKGIVMHPAGLREATRKASEKAVGKLQTRLSPGEKGHRKRMATVVSVYEIAPYFRTPEQILDPQENTDNKRPKPCHKRT